MEIMKPEWEFAVFVANVGRSVSGSPTTTPHNEKDVATRRKNWGLTEERLSRYNSTHFPTNIFMAASVDGKARHHGQ